MSTTANKKAKSKAGAPRKSFEYRRSAVPVMFPNSHIEELGKSTIRIIAQDAVKSEYLRVINQTN